MNRWLRSITPKDVVTAAALLAAILSALGWRYYSPADMDVRVTRLEHRTDSLYNELRFTNFLLCVAFRTDHPTILPPACEPIIDRGARP